MSEIGGEIPVQIIDSVNKDLHKQKITKTAIELAKRDGNKVDENSKGGRLNALLGDELHGKSPDDKADLSLYGKIFNNPDKEDRNRRLETYKEALHSELLMDSDHVPDSHFALKAKIARERNETYLLDTSPEAKQKEGEIIHNDQEKSLDTWIDYLADPDASYPTWFKYYALTSVSKMGVYDKEKHEFSKRTKDTTTIFPDLNREALAYTYDVLQKHYIKHEKHDDEELTRILDTANFSKIYAFAIDKVTPASKENKEKTEGEWTKFNQGDDHTALYESLQGHGTGWCTAGEETAKSQLETGDFYVYYSKDENGKYTIPRIAIRMENEEVAEVRGIEAEQNMEANMIDIAKEKYHSLAGGEKFDKKDHDMKLLTLIDEKTQKNQELTEDEIKFLYQIDNKIEGFGWKDDPRIEEIISKRSFKSDLANIYDCLPNQVIDSVDQITEETKIYFGNLSGDENGDFLNQRKNPLIIIGAVDFCSCTTLTSIPENITFNKYANFKGCKSLTSISENVTFNKSAVFENCKSLTSISENVTFNGPAYFKWSSLTSISENVTFNGNADFEGTALTSIPENITFNGDASFYLCSSLISIPENVTFNGYASFRNCSSLTSISENVVFNGDTNFEGTALTSISENVVFNGDANFENCTTLTSISENVTFGNAIFLGCNLSDSLKTQLQQMKKDGKIKGELIL